jgi:hypothetical protein
VGDSRAVLPLYRGSVENQEKPTAERCIAALVAARGNGRLAAERIGLLTETGVGDEVELQLIIADDPNNIDILTQQIRTHTVLQTFELLGKSMLLLSAQLGQLDSYDLSKHTNSLIQLMERLTDSKETTQNINVNETLLKSLPGEVREYVKVLLDGDATNR